MSYNENIGFSAISNTSYMSYEKNSETAPKKRVAVGEFTLSEVVEENPVKTKVMNQAKGLYAFMLNTLDWLKAVFGFQGQK